MTEDENHLETKARRKPLGDLVTEIIQSISTRETNAWIKDVAPNALWHDACRSHLVHVDSCVSYSSERLRRLLTEP
ncbi:hypothetical protein [Shinella sp.]|uniref:hypothetical protein n=1 Tax=Shinella sp. TaxID=1870904 RepID=UPI00289EFF4A|nr:hypothetical protein [Shinella sp.]